MADRDADRNLTAADGDPDGPTASGTGGRSSSATRTALIGAIVVVVLLGAVAVVATTRDEPAATPTELTMTDAAAAAGIELTDAVDALPPVELEEFAGDGTVPISDFLGGQPLVVNFWATWCGPCVAEMPDFQAVHEAGGGSFRLLGINTQDAAVNAEPFVEELGITYDLAVDRVGEYFSATGSFGMPTTLFVQPDGTVAYRQTGPLSLEQMVELLDTHLDVQVDVPDA